jgi:hypothetical protein
MPAKRFRFALEQTKSQDWRLFEELASSFLSGQFNDFRPMACASGDQGRDGQLHAPEGFPSVVIQMSVAKDWKAKIRATLKRISETLPSARVLIYASSQSIGPAADELQKESLIEHNVSLDIRDRDWFVARYSIDPNLEKAAEEYSHTIVDPIIEEKGLISKKPAALSDQEAQSALVYLELQWADDTREKGLTKLCFEALVRSVLRETTPDNRMARQEILEAVRTILASHESSQLDAYTSSALSRMSKSSVRHYTQHDEFCLSFEERRRLLDRLTDMEQSALSFEEEIGERLKHSVDDENLDDVERDVNFIRTLIERYFLQKGELFAKSVNAQMIQLEKGMSLHDSAVELLGKLTANESPSNFETCYEIAFEILASPSDNVISHIQRLARGYTLLAFLQETPDVQTATRKLFSNGEIWLDASIILPVFAETLLDEVARPFTRMLTAAREAGIKLYVTPGIIEEVAAHINRCWAYERSQHGIWRGRVPFLRAVFAVNAPGSKGSFSNWIEQFCGDAHPDEDISEYLGDYFGVEVFSLEKELDTVENGLYIEIKEIWISIHEQRRSSGGGDWDEHLTNRLAQHDTENYFGVLARRGRELGKRPLGYSAWWLTLDTAAWQVADKLRRSERFTTIDSPIMSADFLLNYLAIGPNRGRLSKESDANLPVIMEGKIDDVPVELMAVVEEIREKHADQPQRIIRRRIRDALDAAKARKGELAEAGIPGLGTQFGL